MYAAAVRRLLSEGNSVRDVLAWLKENGAGSIDSVKALHDASPLSLSEAKVCADDFTNGDARYLDQLTIDRLSLLKLARKNEYLHDFFRSAVLSGKRRARIVAAERGFNFWWEQSPGFWTGDSLPSLDGLAASFRMTLETQPELQRHIDMTFDGQSITLHIRLEGDT